MRILMRWTHLAFVLLLLGVPALAIPVAASSDPMPSSLALAQDDDDGDDDGNKGHGNDDDGEDDDNPGQGNDKDKDKNKDKGGDSPAVEVTELYRVETECTYQDDDDLTECKFKAVLPDGAGELQRVIVPAESVCADIVGGKYETVEVRSGEGLTGYASEEGQDELQLDLQSDVTTAGTTTYWIATSQGLFPAEGPALDCGTGAASLELNASTPAATQAPTPTTGTLAVITSTCESVPADTTGFDWFAQCQPGSTPMTFEIALAGVDGAQPVTASTGDIGEARFEGLEPGNYTLRAHDSTWCHAKSDGVTPESEVIIEAGQQTTVWIFTCPNGKPAA